MYILSKGLHIRRLYWRPTDSNSVELDSDVGFSRFYAEKVTEDEQKEERLRREAQQRSAQAEQAAADRRQVFVIGCTGDNGP